MTAPGSGSTPNAWGEAAAIVEALRAHVEWHRELGAEGLPAGDQLARPDAAPSNATATAPAAHRLHAGVSGPATSAPLVAPGATTRDPHGTPDRAPVEPSAPSLSSGTLDMPRAARRLRLIELAQEIRSCEKCVLAKARTQTVFSRGNPEAELCFVGEGPGADEDAQGEPFVGRAGQLLDKMIEAMGFSRDDVYVCNIVKCRPPNNRKPEPDEMATCVPYLTEQLSLVSPKVIVALGATAVEGLLGVTGGITRMRGQWKLYRGTVPVMPTFHPAYLLRNPAAKREVWADLKAVLAQLGRPIPPVASR